MDPDPLVRGTNPRIRIRTKMSRIPNTVRYLVKGWAMSLSHFLEICMHSSVDRLHIESFRCSWIHLGSFPRLSFLEKYNFQ